MHRLTVILSAVLVLLLISSCSAIFEGGASGKVVDSESTSEPKAGIQDVEVFVYTSEYQRNEDYRAYNGKGRFTPSSSEYIGHTTTASDGSFSLSKIMWESKKPIFGKTGDYIPVYLLFYHENYGLVKNTNKTVILSDSVSNIVYQEMTATRQTTILDFSIFDISRDPDPVTKLPPLLADGVNITVSVPQTTPSDISTSPVIKTATISGTGRIVISYPRNVTETITVAYGQAGDYFSFKPCNFITTEGSENYAFMTPPAQQNPAQTPISDNPGYCQISLEAKGTSLPIQLYMKPTRHSVPAINGQICLDPAVPNPASPKTESDVSDDNLQILLAKVNADNTIGDVYDYNSASVLTYSEGNGAYGAHITHGLFSGLGQGTIWEDSSYTSKYSTKTVALIVDRDKSGDLSTGDEYLVIPDLKSNQAQQNLGIITSADLTTF